MKLVDNKKSKGAQMTHTEAKNQKREREREREKKKLIITLKQIPQLHKTLSMLCLIFLKCIATKQRLNRTREESRKHNLQYTSDTTVTLKQGHQNWY